ncbi:MAG: EamA family transporter [Candidatus Sulfotelmatobacter sp.]|jgi:drug/metabolite transporter (DMT)-like permease
MRTLIFYCLIIGAGTGGELCVARAMKALGEVKDFRPHALLAVIPRALRISWMWLGVALMAIAFFSLLAALSVENVSFVVPVTALSYAAGALGAKFFLGEQVTSSRWVGVLLVCFGVALVIAGRK